MLSSPVINLVSTRCTDGQHLALQRWYADHVHLLLAAPELQRAQLYRCTLPLAGEPPDYFCVYEFQSLDAFAAFEHGQPKARATALTNAAQGRSSIEIVQRRQYVRWLHRSWPAPRAQLAAPWRLAACISGAQGWALDAQRWLADQLQALRGCAPLLRAQAFVQQDQPAHAFLALDLEGADAQSVWPLLQDIMAHPSLYGQAQELTISWAASASPVQAWLR